VWCLKHLSWWKTSNYAAAAAAKINIVAGSRAVYRGALISTHITYENTDKLVLSI